VSLRARIRSSSSPVALAIATMAACALWFGALAACRGVIGIDDAKPVVPGEGGTSTDEGGAGNDAAPAGPRFCANTPPTTILCSDFDDDGAPPIETGWDNKKNGTADYGISGKATISADTTVFFSPPRAAAMDISPLVVDGAHASAFLLKYVKNIPRSLTVLAKFRIVTESIPKNSNGRYVLLYAGYLPGGSINIVRDGKTTQLWISNGDATVTTKYPFTGGDFVVGQWSTISMGIDNQPEGDGGTGKIEIELDGLPVAGAPVPANFQMADTTNEIDFGPLARGPMDELQVDVDDVLIY
jgi:hypothetical protein